MQHSILVLILKTLLVVSCALFSANSIASLVGDLNNDDVVNANDFVFIYQAYDRCVGHKSFNTDADLVVDGCIDIKDVREFFKQVGNAEVYVELVQFGDGKFELGSTDYIQLHFTVPPSALSFSDISLTVEGDTFGDSAELSPGDYVRFDWPYGDNQNFARIYLGKNVVLRQGGITDANETKRGAPSGVEIQGYGVKDLSDSRVRLLQRKFDGFYQNYRAVVFDRVNSGDSCQDNYPLSYDIDGLLAMYEASRNTFYLKEAMDIADIMLSFAKDLDGDGYLDFSARNKMLNDNKPTFNVALCDWKAARPIGRLVWLLRQNPPFASRYARRVERFQSFAEKDIVQKWSRSLHNKSELTFFPQSVYFVENDNLMHRIGHYGEVVNYAWLTTRKPEYEQVLDSIVARVCSDFQVSTRHEGAIEWDIFISSSGEKPKIKRLYGDPYTGISDTSHANGVVSFLVETALRANKSCTGQKTLDDLVYTFTKVITSAPNADKKTGYRFADFVDGGLLEDGQPPYSMGRSIEDGWLNLGENSSEVQRIGQEFYDQGNVVHRLQYTGNLMRNYALNQWQ